jgi:hypothetical protein
MPFRNVRTLESWVAEFQQLGHTSEGSIRVIPQDGEDGSDTGLVGVQLLNSPTEIYIEPPRHPGAEWTITFEPREQTVTLGSTQVQSMSRDLAILAALCAFLQSKSEAFMATVSQVG